MNAAGVLHILERGEALALKVIEAGDLQRPRDVSPELERLAKRAGQVSLPQEALFDFECQIAWKKVDGLRQLVQAFLMEGAGDRVVIQRLHGPAETLLDALLLARRQQRGVTLRNVKSARGPVHGLAQPNRNPLGPPSRVSASAEDES